MTIATEIIAEADPFSTPFLKSLIALIRAEDTYGVWEGKTDMVLLKDYVVTKDQRREIPIIGDPDPDVLARVDTFYKAVGLAIEAVSGRMASPMMKMSHEGFGRVILTTGRLVVVAKSLRDVHRFGFDSVEKLAADGMKQVEAAAGLIAAHPEIADA